MLNAHNVLQSAFQADFGTAVTTSTVKLQNVSDFKLRPEFQTRALNQLRGTLAPTHQTTLDHYLSSATFEVSDESYEDINYWFEMLFGEDASVTGASAPYTREYVAPLTTAPTPHFATLKYGQTGGVYIMPDASVVSLTLSGSNNTGVQVGGSILGGVVTSGTITAGLSDRTAVTRMSGCSASAAVETWTGSTYTALDASAFSWELTINSNRDYRGYLGDCSPTAYSDQKWNGQMRLSLEFNTSTDDYLNTMLAATNAILEKQIRIVYTTGSSATLRSLTITFAGHTMSAPEIFQDKNGIMTYDLVLDGVYNSTLGNWLTIETKCATAILA